MKKKLWLVLVSAFLALPCTGMADETEDDVVLVDDIIVTASRSEQANEKVPVQITVITAEDIRASGAQSVPDALNHLGGVVVSDLNGNGFNQKVDIGGFGESSDRHVAVLVNGRKLNPIDLSSVNFLSIPIENVEKIELVHGGNSVLYGGDAMGGVINIITKDSQDGVHGWAEGGIGSYGTAKGLAGISFSSGKLGGSIGGVFYDTDGYREHSDASRQSGNASINFDPSDTLGFSFEASTTQADYEYPGALTKTQMETNRKQFNPSYPNDEGESQDDAYVLSVKSDWGAFGRLNVDLSYRTYERHDISWGSSYDYDFNTLGVSPQYILDHSIFGQDNRLTLGFEYYDTNYDARMYNWNILDFANYNHTQETAGFYVQDEFSILESLVLNLGARYEEFRTTLESADLAANKDVNEEEWAWNIGLAYIFSPRSKVYVRAYQAYRFPRVDEFMNLTSGTVNSDLTHETSQGFEAGVRYVGLENRLAVDFRLFTFDVDDEITWVTIGWSGENQNLNQTRHQGAEVNADFKATRLISFFGGLGYTDAEVISGQYSGVDIGGKKIPLVPEFKASLGVALNFDFGLTFRCQYNYLDDRYAGNDFYNSDEKLGSAHTVDLYLAYPYKQLEFFLNATNIFNEEYCDGYSYGSGWESYYPAAEAVYYGGVRVKF
ncbi:TonB-dependent receptor [Desulfobacter vibrioformis]|uniref:TonB-dependent receptor n=1 Tax=Desulfobacter vibrioformis TaxID=34031 RepID=UPI000554F2E8|nr:TonB-dependent receptor [Desulfobacter vibrioformis]